MVTVAAPNVLKPLQMAFEPDRAEVQSSMIFEFSPPTPVVPTESPRNYVFVDEHNRHKRLKVMRACEGCRRRKIKCDAATTNTWPCAACVRLKLHCVPPLVHHDRDFTRNRRATDQEVAQDFVRPRSLEDGPNGISRLPGNLGRPTRPRSYTGPAYGNRHKVKSKFPAWNESYMQFFPEQSFQQQFSGSPHQYTDVGSSSFVHHTHTTASMSPSQHNGDATWGIVDARSGVADVSGALGQLKIEISGRDEQQSLSSAPAFEDAEVPKIVNLLVAGPDATVQVPPEIMPSDEHANYLLDIFFNDIHPYVPVIDKASFYEQWNMNRDALSPLLVESIFAAATRLSSDPSQGLKWLALAQQHKECFFDVPRLSTVQAMLILLKARETAPQRGYFFRSWMTIVQVITMAKDLGLASHHGTHLKGLSCGFTPVDCTIRTRIWQMLFICEYMIGSPQGRYDLAMKPDTVCANMDYMPARLDPTEQVITENITYFTNLQIVFRSYHEFYYKMKEQNTPPEPSFLASLPIVSEWEESIPKHLRIACPDDESPLWIQSHFAGNINAYFQLAVIMMHRAQITSWSADKGDKWKTPMRICYGSAKKVCRIQEALLKRWGTKGFACMQRGINCVLYNIMACMLIHLTALTCPDPEFNQDAPDFFTRHMRVLEQSSSLPLARHLKRQIDTLREAFSADLSQPFSLKPNFLPSLRRAQSTPRQGLASAKGNFKPEMTPTPTYSAYSGVRNVHATNTPPLTSRSSSSPGMHANGSVLTTPDNGDGRSANNADDCYMTHNFQAWKPTTIFDQWSAVFDKPSESAFNPPKNLSSDKSDGNSLANPAFMRFQPSDDLIYPTPQLLAEPQLVSQMMNGPVGMGLGMVDFDAHDGNAQGSGGGSGGWGETDFGIGTDLIGGTQYQNH